MSHFLEVTVKLAKVLFVSLLGALSISAFGQSTGSLSGIVTDPTGAVVPGAQVKIHSLATGADRTLVTDSAGLYVAPSLQPGDYQVQAVAPGFSTDTVQKVTLEVDQQESVNLKLAVASAGDTIQVETAGAQIESVTMTVGQVIDRATVQELPLNGRHFLDLTVLTPGGIVANSSGSLTGTSRGLGANSFDSAGNREDSINFQINGVNLNDMSQNQITFQPSISTTSEFKIDNSTFSAEYGRSSGSIVNVATRSGTDKFHGEAFDYFRNEALDARNYFNRSFNPATGLALVGSTGDKAPLKRNNFGGTFGGPIWRGHTFFLASYEGLRQHQGILQNSTVLSNSATTSLNALGQTVYSPNQRAAVAAANNPAANALLAIIPLPNSGNNFVSFTPGPVSINQYTIDGLQLIGSKDQLHAFYAFQSDVRTEPALQGDTIPGFGDHRNAHRQILTLNEIHNFSNNFTNEARLGFNRIAIAFNPNFITPPGTFFIGDGQQANAGIPQTTFTDIGLTIGGPSGFPQGRDDTLGVFSDTATWLKGRHTIKYGGEVRRFLEASFAGDTGTMTYATSLTTSTLSAADAQTKTQADNFESDRASAFSITPNVITSRVYVTAAGGFIQDNFKLLPNLTLEAGLRFEWNGTPTEAEDRFVIFNPTSVTLQQIGANFTGSVYKQNYNVEPRLGFAYDISGKGKTVIRGGYALMADQPVETVVGGLTSNPPFSKKVSFTGSSTVTVPVSSLYASALASGLSVANVNPNFRNAYMETFNLNVQQALPFGLIGSLGYYGSVGRHLRIATNQNQPVGPAGATNLTQVRPYLTLAATSPIDPGASINSNISEANSISSSNYNGLWATLAKNAGHGLSFNLNYEWTKSMDENSLGGQGGLNLQDSLNPAGNYGLSDFDVRNHVAGTAIYNLPFHSNIFTSGYRLTTIVQYQTGSPVNIVASSDSFNGVAGVVRPNLVGKIAIHKVQTAGVANVTFIQSPGATNYGGTVCDTTNATPACTYQIVGTQASATTAAAPTSYNGVGNIQRNAGIGPGFADVDLSGEKETKLFKGVKFTLRADAFDILNHPNFSQPSGNVQSATFGQITATRFATSDGGSSRQLQLSGKFTF